MQIDKAKPSALPWLAVSGLVVVFDQRSTLSLVKIRSKRGSFDLAAILDEASRDSDSFRANQNSFFSEVTDEDIDSLFS